MQQVENHAAQLLERDLDTGAPATSCKAWSRLHLRVGRVTETAARLQRGTLRATSGDADPAQGASRPGGTGSRESGAGRTGAVAEAHPDPLGEALRPGDLATRPGCIR